MNPKQTIMSPGIKFLVFSLLLFTSLSHAAKRKIFVNMVLGDVTYKRGKTKSKPVRKTSRLKEKDVIRTMVESRVELRLEDGTTIGIEENSIVDLAKLVKDGKVTSTNVTIKTGKVLFNVKKLTSKRSDFILETPTATAAIRGTIGGIGTNGKNTFAYLEEGALELVPKGGGKSVTIKNLNVAIQKAKGFDVTTLQNTEALKQVVKVVEAVAIKSDSGNVPIDASKILDTLNKLLPMDSLLADSATIKNANAPDSGKLVDSTKAPIDSVPPPGDSIPPTGDSLQPTGDSVPPPGDSLPPSGDSIPPPGDSISPPSPGDTVKPAGKDSVLDTTKTGGILPGTLPGATPGTLPGTEGIDLAATGGSDDTTGKDQDPPEDTSIVSEEKEDTVAVKTGSELFINLDSPVDGAVIKDGALTISGSTVPNAQVQARTKSAVADAGGNFSFEMKAPSKSGKYKLEVSATSEGKSVSKSVGFIVEAEEELKLAIVTPSGGQEYPNGSEVVVSGNVSTGALVKVNGNDATVQTNQWSYTISGLEAGEHSAVIEATLGEQSASGDVSFIMVEKKVELIISVTQPPNGVEVKTKTFEISGSGTPGAKIIIGSLTGAVDAGGSWRLSLPTPEDPGDHNFTVETSLGDEATSAEISIVVPEIELILSITSPSDGDEIEVPQLSVKGKSTPGASIKVFDKQTKASASGDWNVVLPSPETAGDHQLVVEAFLNSQSATAEIGIVRTLPKIPLAGKVNSVPSQLNVPNVNVSGTCNDGATIDIGGFSTTARGGNWQISVSWPEQDEGTVSYDVVCVFNDEEKIIGEVVIDYSRPRIPLALNLSNPTDIQQTAGELVVRGNVKGRDVLLKINDKAVAISASQFSHIIRFNESNWDLDAVVIDLSDADGDISKTINLEVDKTSPAINTKRPEFISPPIIEDGVGIKYGVKDNPGDEVTVSLYVDGTSEDDFTFEGIRTGQLLPLTPGVHDYKIEAIDLAGNKNTWERTQITHWPRVEWTIAMVEPTTNKRVVRPPHIQAIEGDFELSHDIIFRIQSLPNDDYRYLKEVRVINEANGKVKVWRDIEIDDIEFEFSEVPLVRKKMNKFEIRVEPHNGPIKFKSVTIDVPE